MCCVRVVLMFMLMRCAIPAPASDLVPAIVDPGFEKELAGWGWQVFNGAQVSFELVTADPHSGKRCIAFVNRSGLSPHVYGRLSTSVSVIPSTRYELSCWIRGEDVSDQPGSFHITDWNSYTLDFPGGTFGWKKVSTVFTTGTGQHAVTLGINIANKCKALAVDDIALRPLGGQLQGEGITGVILTRPRVIGHDSPVPVCILLESASSKVAALETTVSVAGRKVAGTRDTLKQGENRIDWEWNTGKGPFGKYDCSVRVVDARGKSITTGGTTIDVVDSPVFAEIDRIEGRKKKFDALYQRCKAKGINLDLPTAARTMLEQFIPLARDDVRAGFEWRAKFAITDFDRSLDEGMATMEAYLIDPTLAPVTRRYQTGKVEIRNLSFIGSRVDSRGREDRGPVFFCGVGHFSQVRKDIPRFPGYGMNIIQTELGPSHVLPAENKIDLSAIKNIAGVLDNAARHNMMVNVLLSPHYFPQWAMKKWPHLGKGGGGFLGYCVDDPAARQVLEKYLRIVIPMLKDKPALHSFCLSNEPVFPNIAGCDNTRQMWEEYLTRTHGDVGTLNRRYGTGYASFAEVPYGGDPQAYDWIVFDQQRFAGWHKWMADIIHEMAPNVPLHAKTMSNQLNPGAVSWATDQELFGNLLEINGNDCYIFPTGNPKWPLDPWLQNTSYDMQRSFAYKPVFNSENHISPDGSTYYMGPEHFRTALWQGAIHGQSATTIWVWEHAYDNSGGFIGNIMDRPGCAQAVGVTCLDLNRFAEEVTALQTTRARVAIVYAMSSIIRHGDGHAGAIWRIYHALNSCGIKIDFISEKQLASGKGSQYRMIVVPEAETLTDAAFAGIQALPPSTRLLLLNGCFARNEYGKKRDEQMVKAVMSRSAILADGDTEKVLWPALRKELVLAGAQPSYSVVDAKTGEPIWGVEWLPAKVSGRTVINIVSFRDTPFDIKILRGGEEVRPRDLLSLGGRTEVSALKLLTPVLAEVE